MINTNRRGFIKKLFIKSIAGLTAGYLLLNSYKRFFSDLIASSSEDTGYNHKNYTYNKKVNNKKEAMYYKRLGRNSVSCTLCFHNCTIQEGNTGFCRVRENSNGRLYSLVYGLPAGLQIDSIEMEPMYHMVPGHRNLCVYTASCNFRCKHCHNWHLSQRGPDEVSYEIHSPYEVVNRAKNQGCKSISHSINEPAVFYEYMYDIAKHAQKEGLLTLFHTNGYLNPEPLKDILKYMDGVTVDLKAFNESFYREISSGSLEPVLETLKIIRKENVHLEIVNLVIPTLNDDPDEIKQMCTWIIDNIGNSVPLHFNRFSPTYKLTDLPSTPVNTLESAANIAYESGLKYVYIGNVPAHKYNSTYCPNCKTKMIERAYFSVLSNKMENGACISCGYEIQGIWKS